MVGNCCSCSACRSRKKVNQWQRKASLSGRQGENTQPVFAIAARCAGGRVDITAGSGCAGFVCVNWHYKAESQVLRSLPGNWVEGV